MKRRAVILCKGVPTNKEFSLRDKLLLDGYEVRIVSARPDTPRNERESCDIAYSFHKALLSGYSKTNLVKPEGVIKAPSGYTIERNGRWHYIIDADGKRVHEKGLSKSDAKKLMRTL